MKFFWIISRHNMELVSDVSDSVSDPIIWGSCEAGHYHYLVPRSRMVELYFHSTIRLHGVMLG
jgi:hypothetical protein